MKKKWGEDVKCSGYTTEPDRWITKYTKNGYHKECPRCGARWMLDSAKHICVETPYCPQCGIKLEKETDDEEESDA